MKIIEATLQAKDRLSLFTRCFEPADEARAEILINHGVGEHCARYWHVAERLVSEGYRVCTYDMRGHGRSEGRRGDILKYELFLDDLELIIARLVSSPCFLYGHSLGGQIVIRFLQERKYPARGVIIGSPWLALAFTPPKTRLFLAKLLRLFWPSFTQPAGHDSRALSRDQEFLGGMRDLHLTHRIMSARMFHLLIRAAASAQAGASDFTLPLFLFHGANDPLTSSAATEAFYERCRSEDKTFKRYPGMLHECHNELGRELVVNDIVNWLNAHSVNVAKDVA
jgi:alpha-beta hydrolase superfamily lysophospholipase